MKPELATPIQLIVSTDGVPRLNEPVTVGVPLPRGRVREAHNWAVSGSAVQTQVLAKWPDGSLRWVLVDCQLSTNAPHTRFTLDTGEPGARGPAAPIRVEATADAIELDTGHLAMTLSHHRSDGLSLELDPELLCHSTYIGVRRRRLEAQIPQP